MHVNININKNEKIINNPADESIILWTKPMESFFIECVKKNRLIYDATDPNKSNKKARHYAFSFILTELKNTFPEEAITVEPYNTHHIDAIRRKYHNLRGKYIRKRKNGQEWSELSFLEPFIKLTNAFELALSDSPIDCTTSKIFDKLVPDKNTVNAGASTSADQDDYEFNLPDDFDPDDHIESVSTYNKVNIPESRAVKDPNAVKSTVPVPNMEARDAQETPQQKRRNEDEMQGEQLPSENTHTTKRKRSKKNERLASTLSEEIRKTLTANQNPAIAYGNYVGQQLNKYPDGLQKEIINKMNKILYEAEPLLCFICKEIQ